jgi:ribosome maturation factor RimP
MRGSRKNGFLFYSVETYMLEKSLLLELTNEYLKDSSSYLVEVSIGTGNNITIEIDNDEGVDIDECVALSRFIESKLDRENDDFELTVTSAGLTSPLKTLRQYKKFEGKEVEVLGKDGRKYKGELKSSNEDGFTIIITTKVKPEGSKRKVEISEEINFKFEEIKHTKYLIRF